MLSFRKFLEMKNTQYDYSSVHIDVPEPLSKEIQNWGREQISDNDIFVSQTDPSFGREDETHITVLYGIHSESPKQLKKVIEEKSLKVKLGKIDVFSNPSKFDVVVIEVESPDLTKMNNRLRNKLEYTNNYPDYKPHVTIAYVKNGKGWKHKNLNKWQGKEFSCDYVVFSSKNGTKEKISL